MDSDDWLVPDGLEVTARYLEQIDDDTRFAGVSGRRGFPDGSVNFGPRTEGFELSARLGNITAKLDRIETSLDYKTQVSGLTALAQQAMRYRPWVMRAFKATENAEDRYTYEFGGATSIRKELVIVGLLPDKFYYPKSTGNGAPYDYTFITWERHAELGYALVGNTTTTWKSDAKNRYHKRTVSADMYDIDNNAALGKQEIYHYLVDYLVWPPRWKVYLYINPVFEVRSV